MNPKKLTDILMRELSKNQLTRVTNLYQQFSKLKEEEQKDFLNVVEAEDPLYRSIIANLYLLDKFYGDRFKKIQREDISAGLEHESKIGYILPLVRLRRIENDPSEVVDDGNQNQYVN